MGIVTDIVADAMLAVIDVLKHQAFNVIPGILFGPITNKAIGAVPNKPAGPARLFTARVLTEAAEDGAYITGPAPQGYAKYAIRKGLPEKEGQRRMAIENEPHTVDDFSGEIEEGYGKGIKKLVWSGPAIIKIKDKRHIGKVNIHMHQADRAGLHYDFVAEGVPEGTPQFEINIYNGDYKGRYAFLHPEGFEPGQRLIIRMKDQGVIIPKPDYTLRKQEIFAKIDPLSVIVERKVDGSLGNAHVLDDYRVSFRSHREGGETYYDRLSALEWISNHSNLLTCRLLFPGPDLKGTVFQGELYHPEGASRVAGIVNSLPDKAIATQRKHGPIKYYVWDILRYKGRDVSKRPYEERRLLAEQAVCEIRRFNKNWALIEERPADETIEQFYNRVTSEPLPQGEGIVIKPRNEFIQKWDKVKVNDFVYFKVKEILPGEGKYRNSMGRMVVENLENQAIGEVGSFAITDEFRKWIWDNRSMLEGEIAKVRVQDVTERGAPRAGVLLGFHGAEDKLALFADSLAGSDEEKARQLMYQLKSSAGWRKK